MHDPPVNDVDLIYEKLKEIAVYLRRIAEALAPQGES